MAALLKQSESAGNISISHSSSFITGLRAEAAQNGTFWSSVFTVFNSAVGSGVLTLAFCFTVAGLVPGLLAMLFFATVMGLSNVAVVICAQSCGAGDYQSIVRVMLGPKASSFMSAIIATYCFFACVGGLIIVSGVLPLVLSHLAGVSDAWYTERPVVVIIGAVIAFPLMCLKEITTLRFSAMLSLASIIYIVAVVVVQGFLHMKDAEKIEEEHGPIRFFIPSWSVLVAFPNVALSMQCQIQVPPIFNELRPELKTVRLMTGAIAVAYMIMMGLYVAIAFFGYYTFRGDTPPNILNAPYDQSVDITIARVCLTVVAICSLPVNHFPVRSALHSLLQAFPSLSSPVISQKFFWGETLSFFVLMVVAAIGIPTLNVLNDIMGATAGMAVIFILPGLFLLKGGSTSGITTGWRTMAIPFLVIGVVMFGVCVGDLVYDVTK